jgi:hypothetical protein
MGTAAARIQKNDASSGWSNHGASNLTPGRIFEGRLAWKYFLSRQRTRCAGVISAGGFLAVAEVSHGPLKAEPWGPGDAR